MDAFKEFQILPASEFPVDAFIIDNTKTDISYDSHWHDYFEMMFILDGEMVLQHNEEFIKAQKNDFFVFHSGVVHSIQGEKDKKGKILIIQFLPDILGNVYSKSFESKYFQPFMNSQYYNDFHIINTEKNRREVFQLVMKLYNDFNKKDQGYELYVKSCIYQLIVYFLRNDILHIQQTVENEEDLKRLGPLLKYIENNFKTEINLSEAARMLNFSYSYLSRYFKKVTGKSFKEYIDFIRVSEAEKLILSKKMNVTAAAFEVGFTNVSSFNRVFKRIKNYSPGTIKRTNTVKK